MKLLTAAALVLLTSSANAEQFICKGVDTIDLEQIEFKAYVDEEYFTVNDTVLEVFTEIPEEKARVYALQDSPVGEFHGLYYDTVNLEFVMMAMPIEDLITGSGENVIVYGFGKCKVDDVF